MSGMPGQQALQYESEQLYAGALAQVHAVVHQQFALRVCWLAIYIKVGCTNWRAHYLEQRSKMELLPREWESLSPSVCCCSSKPDCDVPVHTDSMA
jgi:hypothetical protein